MTVQNITFSGTMTFFFYTVFFPHFKHTSKPLILSNLRSSTAPNRLECAELSASVREEVVNRNPDDFYTSWSSLQGYDRPRACPLTPLRWTDTTQDILDETELVLELHKYRTPIDVDVSSNKKTPLKGK